MKKRLLLTLVAIACVMVLIPACGGGGGGGGGISVTRDMLIGTWVMSTSGGNPCTGCLVLELNADGTGRAIDRYGYFFGFAGTVRGTWEYVNGKLYLRTAGYYEEAKVSMPNYNQLNLSDGTNTNVYARAL